MLRKTVKFSEHCYDFVNIRTNNSDYQNIKRKRIANDTSAQELKEGGNHPIPSATIRVNKPLT